MKQAMRVVLATLITATLLGAAPAAFARGGGGVTTTGPCTAASTWKVTLKRDNGQIEAQFEVDQNVVGDKWKVRMKDNGVLFFSGNRVTKAPSGSFEVSRLTADQAGTDSIVAKATNLSTGEVCKGRGSI